MNTFFKRFFKNLGIGLIVAAIFFFLGSVVFMLGTHLGPIITVGVILFLLFVALAVSVILDE